MTVATETKLMTTEEFLALPDDGIERDLFYGRIREYGMTRRNRSHSKVQMRIGQLLNNWLDHQPHPQGEILGGEAGIRLRSNPDLTVGVDAAYISPQLVAATSPDAAFINGIPTLIAEILSPYDKHEEVADKVSEYLSVGVPLVWIVDPKFQTVTVYRPDGAPQMFNATQDISADPHLPGFRCRVAEIFGA